MSVATVPLAIYQGDTYAWDFWLWEDSDATIPVDLTGVEAKAEIRLRSAAPILVNLPVKVTLPNEITATLSRDDSLKLAQSNARWDMQLTLPDKSVTTIMAGPVTVTRAITESSPA
jgi:hypothetical protein